MLVVQSVLFETLGRSVWWSNVHAEIGATSPTVLIVMGVIIGVVAISAGWVQGGTSRRGMEASV